MSPLKPSAQAAAARRGCSTAAARAQGQPQRGSERSVATRTHIKSWDCITSAGAPRGASGITSRARATLGITAARAFPHAGRWESLATRRSYRGEPRTACAPASLEIITVTCWVRNNRIICQSSDPLGMAITLNQWILLTARAARPDAVAPNARRGTRLVSSQVVRIARWRIFRRPRHKKPTRAGDDER